MPGEIVALHPDPGFRERGAPVLFYVTFASVKVYDPVVELYAAIQIMVNRDHSMIAFHKRNK